MDTRSYLVGMHDALAEFRALDASTGPFDVEVAVAAYERYIAVLRGLSPPAHLVGAHNAVANTCQEMLTYLGDTEAQRRVGTGPRNEQLEAAALAGAAAYRRLQTEADELGLSLWFV